MSAGLNILVIDDDEVDRLAVSRALKQSQIEAVLSEAVDGPSGVQAMRTDDFDCILLDYYLPPIDGLAVLREARNYGIQTPIVVLTGQGDESLVAEVMREGAADYLSKTDLSPESLARSIRHVCRVNEAEQSLRRLASFPELSPTAILEVDSEGTITYLNPSARRIFAGIEEQGIAHPALADWESFSVPLLEGSRLEMTRDVEVGDSFFFQSISQVAGRPLLRVYSVDTTERRRAEQQLRHSAFFDILTDLPNRALFMDRLGSAIEQSRRRDSNPFAVLFLDLDRFKVVNDSLGHHCGDQLLKAAAERLVACVRTEDTVARFGGDEFAILVLQPEDAAEVTRIAGRIQRAFERAFTIEERKVYSTTSIGISLGDADKTPDDHIREADTAMYRAKARGGSSFQVFDRGMHEQAIVKLQMESDLRGAIEAAQFRLVYQPIIRLADGSLAGFEALLRWDHPTRGALSPTEFLGLAEETGVALEIDRWVLERACSQFLDWRDVFGPRIPNTLCVNVSRRQFTDGGLPERVKLAIGEYCTTAPGLGLHIEINESAVIGNLELASETLTELKKIGVNVVLDDFGTGYSSLVTVRRLPIDTLKIDRSIIAQVLTVNEDSEVVRAMVSLARNLDINVVAEGVEEREQYDEVLRMGCDFAQGYWFSKPLDVAGATRLISAGSKW